LVGGGSAYNSGLYFYQANYNPGSSIVIGIDPQAVCRSFKHFKPSDFANGCNNSFFANMSGTTPAPMTLNFAVYNQTDLANLSLNPAPTNLPTAVDGPFQVSLNFEYLPSAAVPPPSPLPATPTATCNLSPGVYSPIDSGLQLDGTRFGMSGSPSGSTVPNSVIVVGNEGSTVDASVSGFRNNDVVDRVGTALNQTAGGFKDTTETEQHSYRVGFLVRDPAGFLFDDGGSGTCTFPGEFTTSVVQGFLNQNKCFIATGAFRAGNIAPIALLREFRDAVLEQFGLGQSFVRWYYAWSPQAAEWLIDHPAFRFPILLALVPLQIFAWTVLHPVIFFFLGGTALILLFSTLLLATRRNRGIA
jgi:hypothetical protein